MGFKSKKINIAADFETTTVAHDCRVWAYGYAFIDSPKDVTVGNNVQEFIDNIQGFNSNCYFHNLKFDGHFILDWLLNNGFNHREDVFKLYKGEFKTLISDTGKFYSITVKWLNGNITEFRDSWKKIPMSVANIAKSFKLESLKGELDYERYRPVGHALTDVERDYVVADVYIIAEALRQVIDEGATRLTVGSDSLAEYKRIVTEDKFKTVFPTFSLDKDTDIRRAYRGGYTYADKRFKGRLLGSGVVLDVNSLYPSVMISKLMPYGEPKYEPYKVEPTKERPLTIFTVTITAKLKPNKLPCIQIKGNWLYQDTEYLEEISEPTELTVTNVDWELYNDHYDIQVYSFDGGWSFKATYGLFDDYVSKWARVKARETGGKREIAKLHLNSLYGKFASNPRVASKHPYMSDEGLVKFNRGAEEERQPVYTPVGVFITSWGRDLTIRAAQQNYSVFAYADTDSLHLLTDKVPHMLNVHHTDMGAWDYEYSFVNAWYIRAKAYIEKLADGSYVNRIAGLPTNLSSRLTFDDIKDGNVFKGKLIPKVVKGGVILEETEYMLKL